MGGDCEVDWNDVQLIVAIGRSGSFARASTLLGASKPTVGRRVAALERSAGVGLFRRSPQGVELTEAGLELLGRAEKLAEDMRHFEVVLGSLKNTKIPVVTVAMSEGVASYLMTPVLARAELGPLGIAAKRLQLEMPQISIVTSARASEADIELVWTTDGRTPRGSGSDKICKLADVSFVPFYSPRYASHAKLPASFDAFANHQLISLKAYAPFGGPAWDEWHCMVGERAKDPMWSSGHPRSPTWLDRVRGLVFCPHIRRCISRE